MAVKKINESTLTSIADAIRGKTGGSALIYPENMASEIASIQTGGGMPSSVTAIDGGSFTPTTDVICNWENISTTLGKPAKYFAVWTDGLNEYQTPEHRGLIHFHIKLENVDSASDLTRYGIYYYSQRQTNGSLYNGSTTMNYANLPEKFSDSTKINVYLGDTYYIANKTYYWLAWA